METRQDSYTFDSRSASMIVVVTGDPIVTVGLVEVMDTMKSSSPSAVLSTMVAIVAFIVSPRDEFPEVNVTVNGNGSLKSEVAIDKCRKLSKLISLLTPMKTRTAIISMRVQYRNNKMLC